MNRGNGHPTVVLGVSASIAAYAACDLILDLKKEGVRVIPVLSKDAHHFVTPLALQSLAGHEVVQDFFSLEGRTKPVHIELAKAADLIVIAPASADIIARISLGLADDVLSCTVLAATSPVIVVPAMNDKMYENPATQEHLGRLRKRGFTIVDPVVGDLVCSDNAMGHIASNDVILGHIRKQLGLRKGRT
jgi:phosphopantothenoylcysteine decarboxylase/phosphopantothenate--cysteine ligase